MKPSTERIITIIADIIIWTFVVTTTLIVLHYGRWIFVADKFIIPTGSMIPTMIPGDRVIVNKLIMGARIYKNLDFDDREPLEYWRVKGLRKLRANDIIVFNFPYGYDDWSKIEFKINYVYGKRVIGAPGDTIWIENGFYRNSNFPGIIGVEEMQQQLSEIPDSILKESAGYQAHSHYYTGWTRKNLGPLFVPQEGSTVHLTDENWAWYERPIEYETGYDFRKVDGKYRAGIVELPDNYTFRKNYVFAGGDNVLNSKDSRYFGLVPEEFVIGVVTRIAFSRDRQTDEFRWDRIWKSVKSKKYEENDKKTKN